MGQMIGGASGVGGGGKGKGGGGGLLGGVMEMVSKVVGAITGG